MSASPLHEIVRPLDRHSIPHMLAGSTLIDGEPVHVATAEDTVIVKLEWSRAGESERQLRDVVGILEMRGARARTLAQPTERT